MANNACPLLFISWAENCSRSDSIARRLGGISVMVYSPFWGSRYSTVLLKYLSQTWKTLRILFRHKPKTVIVMTPPVIACIGVWLYAKLTRTQYAIDAHSGAFTDKRWTWSFFLHGFFSRHALVTLITSNYLGDIIRRRGGGTMIVGDVPVCFAKPGEIALKGRLNMTFVSTFTFDEPIQQFLDAARQITDIHFYVTGRLKDASPNIVASAPSNVTFTDFLSDSDYVALLLGSDAVICLTTEDHTMQRGAYEAVYLRRPVITSTFPILREAFPIGAVHVQSTANDIAAGINEMKTNIGRYQREVEELQVRKLQHWETVAEQLRTAFNTDTKNTAPSAAVFYGRD